MIRYISLDATFTATREAKFANALMEAVEGGDSESFTGAVVEFDQITKLDNWKTAILLKIKRGIQDEPGLT
jgi:alpha-soluble NSF attachment protein